MIIDLHFHTDKYSSCSKIPLEQGINYAASIGIDAICLTEHDVFHNYSEVVELEKRYGIKIFSGVEISTVQGDILCFGLDKIPEMKMNAKELVSILAQSGGATIAAHPFRDNNRGIKELLASLPGLTAVEAWNGNTSFEDNLRAHNLAKRNGIYITGSSDSHKIEKIGCFATKFATSIFSEKELVNALKSGDYKPVQYIKETGFFEELKF